VSVEGCCRREEEEVDKRSRPGKGKAGQGWRYLMGQLQPKSYLLAHHGL